MQNATRNQLKGVRREFRLLIYKAKTNAWKELLNDLNHDPWGAAYKTVLRKTKMQLPVDFTKMPYAKIEKVLEDLFPRTPVDFKDFVQPVSQDIIAEPVTIEEVKTAIKGGLNNKKNTAPGLDGVSKEILRSVPIEYLEYVTVHFQRCMLEGVFPIMWKRARLILLPKPDFHITGKFRPICLLDEIGKTFERIIANRMQRHSDTCMLHLYLPVNSVLDVDSVQLIL